VHFLEQLFETISGLVSAPRQLQSRSACARPVLSLTHMAAVSRWAASLSSPFFGTIFVMREDDYFACERHDGLEPDGDVVGGGLRVVRGGAKPSLRPRSKKILVLYLKIF